MVPGVQTLQLDEARVTVVNVGDFHAPLWDEWLVLTPADFDPKCKAFPASYSRCCSGIK
jgi:hypothetical protein